MNTTDKAANASQPADPFTSQGTYPAYEARWHLDDIGLGRDALYQAWGEAVRRAAQAGARPTRIAVIDTPVALDHPNLQDGALDLLRRIDLVTESREDVMARVENGGSASPSFDDGLRARASHGTAVAGLVVGRPTAAALFSADILRNTPVSKDSAASPVNYMSAARKTRLPLAFTGIDPTATVVSIAISAEPSVDQMNRALDHIEEVADVDLIVFAADLNLPGMRDFATDDFPKPADEEVICLCNRLMDLSRRIPIVCAAGNEPIEAQDDEVGPEIIARYLEGVIVIEAEDADDAQNAQGSAQAKPDQTKIKVKKLCVDPTATGGGTDREKLPRKTLAFPAILADDTNGIISVTAHNAARQRASYAPTARNITFSAPSSDIERLDRDLVRLDRFRIDYGEYEEAVYLPGGSSAEKTEYLPPHAIITTDVPGRYGQNGSGFDDPVLVEGLSPADLTPFLSETDAASLLPELALKLVLEDRTSVNAYSDFASNYCFFGGTSAACAIVAGVISLAMSTGRFPELGGVELKKNLANGQARPIDWTVFNQDASRARFGSWQGNS